MRPSHAMLNRDTLRPEEVVYAVPGPLVLVGIVIIALLVVLAARLRNR